MGREEREDRRERRRAGSSERDSKHVSGGRNSLAIPSGLEIWSPKAGTYCMDIVPYVVGDNNPYCHDKGAWYWEMTYFVHPRLGVNQDAYCCPAKMRKERCPVCEHRTELERQGKPKDMADKQWKDTLGSFRAKERQLFLIHLRNQDEDKLLLWDISNFLFGDILDKIRRGASEDESHKKDFDDPDAGSVLGVGLSEESGGEGFKPFLKCYNIEFTPRPKGIDPALLDHNYCLDSIPQVVSYDELKKVFLQMDTDEDKPDDELASRTGKKKLAEQEQSEASTAADCGLEEGMKIRHRQFGICEIIWISEKGTTITIEDDAGTKHASINPGDVRVIEESASAKKAKVQVGDWVIYREKKCQVTGVTAAEKSCSVKNDLGKVRTGVSWDKVELAPKEKKAPPPADDDGWGDDPEPNPTSTSANSASGGSGAVTTASPSKDDGWDDDPKPAKKKTNLAALTLRPEKSDDGWD